MLPERGQNFEGTAIVSGWGSLSEQGASPDVLMKVAVPVVTDEGIENVIKSNHSVITFFTF